jgi:dipeptide transport system ATP-binding protein
MNNEPKTILKTNILSKYYISDNLFKSKKIIKALNSVSIDLQEGETLGLVGESGCGKSTLAKTIIGLESKTKGSIFIHGRELSTFSPKELSSYIQMIFQDPYSSLNPRKKAWEIVSDPLRVKSKTSPQELKRKAIEMIERVGLRADLAERYPHMFSGGQRQRLGIARALITNPKVIICDEPVSALDVSVQAQVINLLKDLQKELNLSYLFISHDLSVVKYIADRIAVMYLGKIVEQGDAQKVFNSPLHPYTQALIQSAPDFNSSIELADIETITGELPSPLNPPSGCHFSNRCPHANELCHKEYPLYHSVKDRLVACHLADEQQKG